MNVKIESDMYLQGNQAAGQITIDATRFTTKAMKDIGEAASEIVDHAINELREMDPFTSENSAAWVLINALRQLADSIEKQRI